MKISFLLPDLRLGGAERVCIELAREFARAGHDVDFAIMQARGELLGVAEAEFSVSDLGVRRVRSLPGPLARYLRVRVPGAVIASMWPLTVVAPIVARGVGYSGEVIVVEHNSLTTQYNNKGVLHAIMLRLSTGIGYRLASARVGVSRGVAKDMARLAQMSHGRIATIYNPVPPIEGASSAALAQVDAMWGVSHGARILSVGTLKRQKNHALLLRAFAQMKRDEARLMFVGGGDLEEDLRECARQLGISDRVIFAGSQPDPSPYYLTADLFVLSSDYEGFGNVIVEALGSGRPVVSTDCESGPSEILDAGRFGILVPTGNSSTLASAMLQALDTHWDSGVLMARAQQFAPSRSAGAYLSLLSMNAKRRCDS